MNTTYAHVCVYLYGGGGGGGGAMFDDKFVYVNIVRFDVGVLLLLMSLLFLSMKYARLGCI